MSARFVCSLRCVSSVCSLFLLLELLLRALQLALELGYALLVLEHLVFGGTMQLDLARVIGLQLREIFKCATAYVGTSESNASSSSPHISSSLSLLCVSVCSVALLSRRRNFDANCAALP